MQVLTALFDFIKEESHRDPDLNVETLIQMIDLMKANSIPLPLIEVAGSEKAVNLLTAHGSKGLEFEISPVFFAGCNAPAPTRKKTQTGQRL